MALRLSQVLGRSAESWLAMQDSDDLWQARQSLDLSGLTPMELTGRGAPGFQAAAAPGQGGCGQDCC